MSAERRTNLTVADLPLSRAELERWEGWCLMLVDDLLHAHPTGQILYVTLPDDHPRWTYHAALVLDGLVYDAWHWTVRLPPAEYVRAVFGEDATWEINPDASKCADQRRFCGFPAPFGNRRGRPLRGVYRDIQYLL